MIIIVLINIYKQTKIEFLNKEQIRQYLMNV